MAIPFLAQFAAEYLGMQAKLFRQILLKIATRTQEFAQAFAKYLNIYTIQLVYQSDNIVSLNNVPVDFWVDFRVAKNK